jgi:hypothetical protein
MGVKNLIHKVISPVIRTHAPNAQIRVYGMHPLAWAAYLATGLPVSRIGQTIGHAAASAGTHVKTGVYKGADYSPCFDLRIHDLTDDECRAILVKLADHGIAAFYRKPGHDHWPSTEIRHIHAIWPDCQMTPIVERQVHDWLCTPVLNGLASHAPYVFFQNTHGQRLLVRILFARQHKA